MKKFVSLTLLMLLAVAGVSAEIDWGVDASAGMFSNYIWRGTRLSEDWVLQPSLTFSIEGAAVNIWGNYDAETEELNEVDYTVSYGFTVNRLNLEAGYIHYDIKDGLDSDEIYAALGLDVILSPSLTVYGDIKEGDGMFLVAGLGHDFALPGDSSISLGASAGYIIDNGYVAVDMNGEEFSALYNGEVSASASIPICKHLSIEPMIAYSFPLSDDAKDAIEGMSFDSSGDQFYGGATLTVSF